METKLKFTLSNIQSLQWNEGTKQTLYWDTHTKGLGLRVTKGKKTFFYEQRLHGKTVRLSLPKAMSESLAKSGLDGVRAWATKQRDEINQFKDPRETEQYEAKAKADRMAQAKEKVEREKILVGTAWNDYIEYQKSLMPLVDLEKGKKWGERHLTDHLNMAQPAGLPHKRGKGVTVQGVLYPLLSMKLAEVSSVTLKDWLSSERKTRANNARQGFEKFRTFWKWCAKDSRYKAIIDPAAVVEDDLLAIIPSKKSKKDGDVLRKNNIADWFSAVQKIPNKVISAYLQCLLICGARRGELIDLKWSDVDFKTKIIHLKDKMTNQGRDIPLNLYMEHLIDALPRRNDYVFSSLEAKGGYMTEPRIAHNRAIAAAGIPHLSIHGLRRSFASLFIWAEQPDGVGARIQGHTLHSARERHYLDIPVELLARWHDPYVNWLLTEAGIPLPVEQNTQGT